MLTNSDSDSDSDSDCHVSVCAIGVICCNGTARAQQPHARCCGIELYYPDRDEDCFNGKIIKSKKLSH